ncbi:MAG: FAD-binding protein, partial [Phycisphaeraceae bacterium]|nr:FAD-binding protein [Phycisphaeraceae bacterium]
RIDACDTPIPVLPGQHYSMGGIDVDLQGASNVQGFFACGECACVSVHGANRLGGNSLLETLVFGRLTGEAVSEFLEGCGEDVDPAPLARAKANIAEEIERLAHGKLNAPELRDRMRSVLSDHAGIFREEGSLITARDHLRQLAEDVTKIKTDTTALRYNGGLVTALELPLMLDLALIICTGALARTESRGSHFRTDHTTRDDVAWLKHTVATLGPEGPQLQTRDVDISKYPPVERKY